MALVRDRRAVEDDWITLDDDAAVPAGGSVIVSLARWRRDCTSLIGTAARIGVRLSGDDAVADIADALDRLDLVALAFPAFTDGRAYSMARLLRERHGFDGEVRAVGHILRDQASLMARCGFDAFELGAQVSIEDWLDALSEISVRYQPAADRRRTANELRHPSL
jgi:uncharacterized protein (DUF934 family)